MDPLHSLYITVGIHNHICRYRPPLTFHIRIMYIHMSVFTHMLIIYVRICISFSLSHFLPFPFLSLCSLLFIRAFPSDRPHSFPSRYTFDKVTAVHYPGRSFTAVIYDYYYCAVMAAAIAWLPHIEKLFLPQRKRVEHYGTKVATSRPFPLR